jgi:RNA polymerase sigma factor (sigma-70 family)
MIDVTKHTGLIFNIARKVKNSFPSIYIQDIVQEINILVIKYSSPIKEGERRTVCYSAEMGAESTFIMNYIARKIMQTIKYSGLIDCQSTMQEGKQVYEYMNAVSMNSTVDSEDESIELVNSLQVLEGHESMYNNTESETDFGKILSVSNITDKEKNILSLRFEQGKTLKEIGELLNISNERVRQIEEKAIAKMKSCKAIRELG